MNYQRFEIGNFVKFNATSEPEYNEKNKRILTRRVLKSEYQIGIVVGIKQVQLGKYCASFYNPSNDDSGGAYLEVEKVVSLWQIKIGIFNKIILVADSDIQIFIASNEVIDLMRSEFPRLVDLPKFKEER